MKPIVYLAGLISTHYPETLNWRIRCAEALEEHFDVRDPLRGKPNLSAITNDGGITANTVSSRSIVLRDFHDVTTASVILANLNNYGSPRPMVGTPVELGWAWEHRVPVVAICDESSDVESHAYLMRRHPFISQFITEYFGTEAEAIDFILRYHA